MKTIGLIGGMSWESTVTYYELINKNIKNDLGGLHSAKILLYSVDFEEIEKCQSNGDWNKSAEILSDIAIKLEKAGADFILICTNTMHKVADKIKEKISIPLIHIVEVLAEELKKENISKVALLGTKYTMIETFYKQKLFEANIDVIIPDNDEIETVNDIIFQELCLGIISESSKNQYLKIIEKLQSKGAEGVILGCTEIGLLINQKDLNIPVFDTTEIHSKKAAILALKN